MERKRGADQRRRVKSMVEDLPSVWSVLDEFAIDVLGKSFARQCSLDEALTSWCVG